jgi:aryl-alcohol dehydrogenase-like predicted oxidoreductase
MTPVTNIQPVPDARCPLSRIVRPQSPQRALAIADRLREVAEEKGCTPAQLALAWLLHRSENVIPIPGTSSVARLDENIHAADIRLSDEEAHGIEDALPKGSVAGERYAPAMMKIING